MASSRPPALSSILARWSLREERVKDRRRRAPASAEERHAKYQQEKHPQRVAQRTRLTRSARVGYADRQHDASWSSVPTTPDATDTVSTDPSRPILADIVRPPGTKRASSPDLGKSTPFTVMRPLPPSRP